MEPWLSAADRRLTKPRKKQIRVLTVDSDPAFLQAVKTGLPKEWKVHTTSDPGQASTWLQREALDLAIVDLAVKPRGVFRSCVRSGSPVRKCRR